MNRRLHTYLYLPFLIAPFAAACTTVAHNPSSKTIASPHGAPLSVVVHNNIAPVFFLQTSLNGQDRKMQLDTGSSISILADDEQTKSLPQVGKVEFAGASYNPQVCDQVTVARFEFAGQTKTNLRLTRCHFGNVENLGMDLLNNHIVSLNFTKAQLSLINAVPTGLAMSPLRRGPQGYMELPVRVDGASGNGFFDTGCGVTIVDDRIVQSHPHGFEPVPSDASGETRGMPAEFPDATGHTIHGALYVTDGLQIGSLKLPRQLVVSVPLTDQQRKMMGNPIVVIGANSIVAANWIFDLKNNLWSAVPTQQQAPQGAGLQVAADETTKSADSKILTLKGNAHLVQDKKSLTATQIVVDTQSWVVEATGECAYDDGSGTISKSDSMSFKIANGRWERQR